MESVILLLVCLSLLSFSLWTRRRDRVLDAVADHCPDPLVIVDLGGRVLAANTRAREMFPDITRRLSDAFPAGTAPELRQALSRAAGGETEHVELTGLGNVTCAPLRNYRGRVRAMSVVLQAAAGLRQSHGFDELTGLQGPDLFHTQVDGALSRAIRDGTACAVLLLEINDYPELSATHGPALADEILSTVTERLSRVLRASDTVARLGMDEFGVLLPRGDARTASLVAMRLLDVVGGPMEVDGVMLDIGIGIGIALYPEHGEDAESLIDAARAAMQSAQTGCSGYALELGIA